MMKETPGFKQTEVGVIPEDWAVSRIESMISEISMGPFGSDIKVSNFVSEGVPVLSGANVRSERLRDSFENFVTPAKAQSLKKAVARKGDVVVTHRGTLGQVSYIPEDSAFERYVISQSQFRARFIEDLVSPSWVVLYFHSARGSQSLLEGKGHTGVPAIAQPTKTFRQLCIPRPPLPEQRAVVAALSDVDLLLEGLNRLIAKKQALKQATMQQLLTGTTRLSGFNGGWEVKRLGEVAEIVMGQSPSSANYNSRGEGLPLIQGNGDIANRRSIRRIFTTQITKRGRTGDVLLSVRAPVGEVSRAMFDVCLGRGVCAIRFPNDFLYHSLILFEPYWAKHSKGSTFDSVNSADVNAVEIRLPTDPTEQSAIAEVLSDMDSELSALEARREKTRALKQAMMQALLTGRIRLVSMVSVDA